jgi:hypothetical protein
MKLKALALITITVLLMISCEVTGFESSSQNNTSIESNINKDKSEVINYVNLTLNEASSISMDYKVKTYLNNQSVEVIFYYVSNNSDNIADFEMTMITFMKVISNGEEQELMISQSYYFESNLYITLLNSNNGLFDKYVVNFDPSLTMDELSKMIGINLFYTSPSNDLFSLINTELLNKAVYTVNSEYIFNFTNIKNEANLKYIKVDKGLSKLTIVTDERDSNSNKVEQNIVIEPKFNGGKNKINKPSDFDTYQTLSFDDLKSLLNL